ncbi:anhydro-N-acetylmuramic acid kinase [Paenarthrobacter nitroguajacolicus]|uniref:anhydro-N-acetylmuramic acid kinase n=1 Tax=Paenarthrobacter nitroguajacolicus TaxID=211146 RepID=UPI00248B3342|nr:anhydro-N-acetylmuramic acid kinase [Paenarthrobacter nitroguajacolicus]MDI2033393.1 Anhydro-N-acetylmuramic acid kinase [Paenarthrobacter nitroguajacolicus]
MRIIGMMSGTSYDAIDAVAVDITREGDALVIDPRGAISEPYPDELLAALAAQMPPATTSMEQVCRLDAGIGQAFARLAAKANDQLCDGQAEVIASHGQTVFHWVEGGTVHGTLQLGEPSWIAEATGCTVVSNFRSRDVSAGGQGAPLVSLFDTLWLRGMSGTPVALNLGGIANITVVSGEPIAFDTGPANALIDAAITSMTAGKQRYDHNGELGARGTVHAELLNRLLDEPYYSRPAPKTTGKELFHLPYLTAALADTGTQDLPAEDVIATLVRLTARTVTDAVRAVGGTSVVVSGGGTLNPTLMRDLEHELENVELRRSDELGLPSSMKEACAFAVLGYLSVHNLPATVPSCTGARHASILGSITPGTGGIQIQTAVPAPTTLSIVGVTAGRLNTEQKVRTAP